MCLDFFLCVVKVWDVSKTVIQCEKGASDFTTYQTDLVNFGCDREEMLNKVVTVYSVALETETSVSMQASDAAMVRFDFLTFLCSSCCQWKCFMEGICWASFALYLTGCVACLGLGELFN